MNRLLACLLMLVLLSCQADATLTIVDHSPAVAAYDVELDSGFAYVATQFDLCKVDLATFTLNCIGIPPAKAVALDGSFAYVATDAGLFQIDLASFAIVNFINTPSPAKDVALDGGFAYVATDGGVCMIDLASFAIVNFIGTPPAKAVALDGGFAYVATDAGLYRISLATFTFAGDIVTPPAKAVALDGGFAYVATDGGVHMIDLAGLAIVNFIGTPPAKAVALDGSFAYVATDVGVLKFSLSSFGIVGFCPITQARGVAVNGGFIYVAANDGLFKLADINCIEGYKRDTLGMGLSGWMIFIDRDGDRILDPGEPSVITDSSGHWKICGLDSFALANVTEVAQPGWKPSLPPEGWQIISVLPDNGSININFTNQNVSCIDGYKLDTFGNVLEGWTIFVDKDDDGILDAGEPNNITDSSGYWQICGLNASSTVNVTEVSQPGWEPSLPPEGWQTVTVQPNNETGYINFTNQIVSCTGAAKTITVCASGCNYTSIQAAINAACPGDTIEVQSGTYNEHVLVNKTLILQGVDSGSGLPVVDGGGSGGAITLSADGCTLQGFAAMNSGSANSGITVSSSSNTVSGNTVNGSNQRGISLNSSNFNTISGNAVTGAIQHGIYLTSSSNNTISSNTANGNSGSGIYLTTASNSNIVSANTASNNQYGIRLYASNGNTITGNTANNNVDGFRISTATENTIKGNTANSNSDRGIYLASSSNNNIIWDNTVTDNANYGIRISFSSGNTVYLNTLSNFNNALSDGTNHWNATMSLSWTYAGSNLTGFLGNIWSDYAGFDCDGDGMGDTPYLIAGGSNRDYNPLGGVLSIPGLEAEKSADRSEAKVGDWINYTVRVNNTGNVNLTGVRVEDNLTGAVWNVGTLEPGQNYTNNTSYRVNQTDLPGPLANELRANGTDPCGGDVNDSAIETVNITSHELLCISGYKFDGCTGLPLSGWRIKVNNSTQEWNTTTDGNGFWRVCRLEDNETYSVCEVMQPYWTQTSSPLCHTVTLAGFNITNLNFINQKLYCISGYKKDNCTGAPLPGWNITLTNATHTVSQLTGPDGKYEFCILKPGDYTITEEVRAGYGAVTATSRNVTLNCSNITYQNFTNSRLFCIGGYKNNACTGEPLGGWRIDVYNASTGAYLGNDTTDSYGWWQVCGLPPGLYNATETVRNGWQSSEPSQLAVLGCSNNTSIDFYNTPLLCIGGYKYNACTGEPLRGWRIDVYNASTGAYIRNDTTDSYGW